ncbi:MAG: hypothetical protein ACKOPE_00625 [Novosphingobium sp.]
MTDQTADFHADQIDPTSITADAARGESDAQADDDERWIETVLTSLSGRSRTAREALAKALLDGDGSENTQFRDPTLSAPVGCAKKGSPSLEGCPFWFFRTVRTLRSRNDVTARALRFRPINHLRSRQTEDKP